MRYRKLSTCMWGDARFRVLSRPPANAQTLWVYLLSGPHTTAIPGLFTVGEAGLAEALGWSLPGFRRAFAEIVRQQMVQADWPARVVWIPKALDHNPPESPSVVKAWAKTLAEIPECALKRQAEDHIAAWLAACGTGWATAWPTPCAGAAPHQEQEQEQEQEQQGAAPEPLAWLDILNTQAGTDFKPTEPHLRPIRARLREGYTRDQAETVVRVKIAEWRGTDFAKYLRPSTLFGPHFDGYLQASRNGHGSHDEDAEE
jgi:uncharacterized phage protein (TIGR02220 family)